MILASHVQEDLFTMTSQALNKPQVKEVDMGGFIFNQCMDCGAYAAVGTALAHYKTCKPGEAEKWENYYDQETKT